MTRICEYPSCGKELIRRPSERPGRFAQRHFCDKGQWNFHRPFSASKAAGAEINLRDGGKSLLDEIVA
jgi:hypothetical protein